jgi:hypothetical protein
MAIIGNDWLSLPMIAIHSAASSFLARALVRLFAYQG